MTAAFVAAANASASPGTSGATLTCNAPAGIQAGDILIAIVGANGSGRPTISTVPSGWTQLDSQAPGTTHRIITYYKVATGSEPSTYSWGTTGTTANWVVGIAAYRGTSNAIDTSSGANGSSASVAATGVTLAGKDLVVFLAYAAAASSFTPAGSYTERVDGGVGGGPVIEIADQQYTAAGATGTVTATASASGAFAAFLAAILVPVTGAPLFMGAL